MKLQYSFKVAGVFLKENSHTLLSTFKYIQKIFTKHQIELLLIDTSAKYFKLKGYSLKDISEKSDFLISLGGDGTLLGVVRRTYQYNKPILAIHSGTLGFLAEINPYELDSFLSNLLVGKYRIDERIMLKGLISNSNNIKNQEIYAFNDIVISRHPSHNMISVEAFIDNEWFNTYKGDGLIISTPTGSTAYSLASGGSILYPLTKAFIITPVSPHSLTQRPLVLPSNFIITFKLPYNSQVTVDGQDNYNTNSNNILEIKVADSEVKILHKKEKTYFETLRQKLHWGK